LICTLCKVDHPGFCDAPWPRTSAATVSVVVGRAELSWRDWQEAGCPQKLIQREKKFPREYQSWRNMRQRCNNPNIQQWADYGGRGITVCSRWSDFSNFLADMARCGLDHPRAIPLTLNGENRTVGEWAKIFGINVRTRKSRLSVGMSLREAVKSGDLRSTDQKSSEIKLSS
jgi:hypothetical protein